MTLSVGFGRITNDPEAPIRTRKALGRLATPGMLVTDKGLTIDTNGRMVLRLNDGLYEDSNGLSVKLAVNGGLEFTDDGLAVSDAGDNTFGDITANSITVLGNSAVAGSSTVAGLFTSANANVVGAINSNSLSSLSLSTGVIDCSEVAVSGDVVVGGTFTVGVFSVSSLDVIGDVTVGGEMHIASHATVGGDLTITGNVATAGDVFFNSNATVAGTLTAGAFSPGSITTGAIVATTITCNSVNSSGSVAAATLSTTGNATIGGNLTVTGSYNPSSISTGAITASSVAVSGALTANNATITGGMNAGTVGAVSGTFVGAVSAATVSTSGNATIGGQLRAAEVIIGGGVRITRALGWNVTLNFFGSHSGADVHQVAFALSGALANDLLLCSIIGGGYGPGFGSWSAAMTGNGAAIIRAVLTNNGTPFNVSVTFRVLALRLI